MRLWAFSSFSDFVWRTYINLSQTLNFAFFMQIIYFVLYLNDEWGINTDHSAF